VSSGEKPAIVVTGISGNLGSRLLPLLGDFNVIGVDIVPPRTDHPLRFENIDLGREACCRQLVQILREFRARAIVHLAFVFDQVRSGVLDAERMWQINVAGTARVMEAITEANRRGVLLDNFIFPSSTFVYGPETQGPVRESQPLAAELLPYALQKQEADQVLRLRADSLGSCATHLLRCATFSGASMQNYLVGTLRGTPTGKGKRAERMIEHGKRVSLMTPGKKYRDNLWQFVHVDDVARLISWILRKPASHKAEVTILNVAGRGDPISFEDVAALGHARVRQVPGKWAMREALRLMWSRGVSAVPPEAAPYLFGSCLADTSRLKQFLGSDYEKVIQYSIATALQDTFNAESKIQADAIKA